MSASPSWFQRYLLPGFAFKAVVIGGGYATGRELAEFFLPSGPWGGVMAILLAMVIWSVVCVATFLFARATDSRDYRTFFRNLLGPFWIVFEGAYFLFIVLILAVFGAAAGAIGNALFGWPPIAGTLCFIARHRERSRPSATPRSSGCSSGSRSFSTASMRCSSSWRSARSAIVIARSFALEVPTDGWALGGLTYAGYNIVGAVVILPVLRHLTSNRDAVIAGALSRAARDDSGVPVLHLHGGVLPADRARDAAVGLPAAADWICRLFHVLFQLMIFSALLESGTGWRARDQRAHRAGVARTARGASSRRLARLADRRRAAGRSRSSSRDRFGLVTLIARGYRALAYVSSRSTSCR